MPNNTTKPNRPIKTSAGAGAVKRQESWYFIRLALLAVPWKSRAKSNAKGTLFKQYHVVRAKDIRSALRKADRMLGLSEHPETPGTLNGKKVSLKKIGILDLEPVYQPIKSGVELFDESEIGVPYTRARTLALTAQQRSRMIAYEKKAGKPDLHDIYWGEGFERL